MNATMLAVLNESERRLAAETERDALAAVDGGDWPGTGRWCPASAGRGQMRTLSRPGSALRSPVRERQRAGTQAATTRKQARNGFARAAVDAEVSLQVSGALGDRLARHAADTAHDDGLIDGELDATEGVLHPKWALASWTLADLGSAAAWAGNYERAYPGALEAAGIHQRCVAKPRAMASLAH